MIKESYIKLGEFIEQCNERNINEYYGADELRGINNEGNVMPSKANIIGVSFHTYKIAHKGYFIYNPARLDIGSISCLQEEVAIFSQMYVIFKIKEECKNTLLTEYLWMWFKRKEFFRYVAFVNFGSVREMFTYEDMCNVMLHVPPIEEQRRIVSEYQTVERRIANNEALIQKLEETAQAIYHHTFVEGIDEENLPEGWRKVSLCDIVQFKVGGDKPNVFSEKKNSLCNIPIYSNGISDEGIYGYTDKATIIQESITISARGVNSGVSFLRRKPYMGVVRLVSIIPKDAFFLYYLFYNISSRKFKGDGSAQSQITVPQLENEIILTPPKKLIKTFYIQIKSIHDYIDVLKDETNHLRTLLSLLTSKLS